MHVASEARSRASLACSTDEDFPRLGGRSLAPPQLIYRHLGAIWTLQSTARQRCAEPTCRARCATMRCDAMRCERYGHSCIAPVCVAVAHGGCVCAGSILRQSDVLQAGRTSCVTQISGPPWPLRSSSLEYYRQVAQPYQDRPCAIAMRWVGLAFISTISRAGVSRHVQLTLHSPVPW